MLKFCRDGLVRTNIYSPYELSQKHSCVFLLSAEIPKHALSIFFIFFSECRGQIFFLLQNLQVQHDNRKQGKEQCQRIEIHQQNPDIHKIKAQKCRIAAEFVNAACDKFGFVLAGNSGTPAVPHADDRGKENQISEDSRTKAGEASADRDIVSIEYDGEDLRERGTECGNAHKQFYRMYGFFLFSFRFGGFG